MGRKLRKQHGKRTRYVTVVLFGLTFFFLFACYSRNGGSDEPLRTYHIGINSNVKSTPVIIADEKGFFRGAGLSVTVGAEPSSLHLLEGLYAGSYDFVCVPSFLVARDYLAGKSLRVLAVLNRNQSRYVLMDPGQVENPADFPGKTIGITPDSAADFVLMRFLVLHGVDPASITIRYYGENVLPGMLASGNVSAILTWPPFVSEARNLMKGNVLVTNAQMGMDMYWLLVSREDVSRTEQEGIARLFRGIDKAYDFIFEQTDEAKDLVASRLSVSRELIDEEWRDFSFLLEMPQSLLLVMEQQARWIADRQGLEFNTADYFSIFDYHHLESEYPERVSIIR